jgi:hypothetical protein
MAPTALIIKPFHVESSGGGRQNRCALFFCFFVSKESGSACTSLEKGVTVVAETLDCSVRDVSCQLNAGCVELGKRTGV